MAHAQNFKDFIPTVAEALLYEREWKRPERIEYQRYNHLTNIFSDTNSTTLQKCELIAKTYTECLRGVSIQDAAFHIDSIKGFANRMKSGDIALVDEIKRINDTKRNMYVFATMYCNHSNPEKFWGYSKQIGIILMNLNAYDKFCLDKMDWETLRTYSKYTEIMNCFVSYYHLQQLTTTQIDIMLRDAYTRYKDELNIG